ncbi:MAG: primosomal protein N' [Magnetococcales bacterium]|nr:primosomal protein N' [Magnetococcales bacterium]
MPGNTLFTYALPDGMTIETGSVVLVPAGNTHRTGVVWEVTDQPAWPEERIREVAATLGDRPLLGADLIHLLAWMARYYLVPLGVVVAAALPGEIAFQRKRRLIWEPANPSAELPASLLPLAARLQARPGGLSEETLAREFGSRELTNGMRTLRQRGWIRLETTWRATLPTDSRPPTPPTPTHTHPPPILTAEQNHCVTHLHRALTQHTYAPFLLEGVTGSGKTEVYIRAIEQALALGRQALLLVPEIALTSQMVSRLQARFSTRLALLHSGLSRAQRPFEWWRIHRGEARVAVGARSALFAPFTELGLVIVDEEHDPSYKQEGSLPYQARDMAAVRARACAAVLLLGSATPSLESLANVARGKYTHLQLTQRVGGGHPPRVATINLTQPELRRALGRDGLISPPLAAAMTATLEQQRQILLFLNRRGFAPSLLCYRCGQAIQCPHCSVTLTLHKNRSRLLCHYCDFSRDPLDICPACGQLSLYAFGPGTQKLEEECRRLFPQARLARLDRDAVSARSDLLSATLEAFGQHQLDILIGTQMVAKGHHFPGLSLVGVIQAETGLCQPDFRAAERTWQLITQVIGRAGREDQTGSAIVQTLDPHHYAIAAALGTGDGFVEQELAIRRQAGYPPWRRLALLRFSSAMQPDGASFCQTLKQLLPADPDVEWLGPAPAPLFQLRNRYRWQLLIKEREGGRLHQALTGFMAQVTALAGRKIRCELDVDPQHFL